MTAHTRQAHSAKGTKRELSYQHNPKQTPSMDQVFSSYISFLHGVNGQLHEEEFRLSDACILIATS